MKNNDFFDGLRPGRMTRREFHKALAAAGLGLATVPIISRPGHGAENPMMFVWGGYEDPGFHPDYLDKYGASPDFTTFADEEESFAKIRAGFQPDVTQICSYKVPLWRDAGILAEIDVSRLSNWADVLPTLKEVPGTVIDGKHYWVCQDWGQTSIVYRSDLVDPKYEEEPSWGLLWDERYTGRLAMIDSLIDGVMVAAIYGGAGDPFNMTAEEIATTKELLQKQRPLLRYYTSSMTDIENAIASGELVAAGAWNEAYAALLGEGVPVKWMKPKEGAMTWTCGITLQPWAQNVDRCYDLIDAYLSPRAGQFEITEFGYGHANLKAYELVSEEDLTALGLSRNPEPYLKEGIFQKPIQNEPELQTMFEEVKAGF